MKKILITSALLAFLSGKCLAYVTFYNNSSASIKVSYKLCTPGIEKCSVIATTPSINPNSSYKDENINLSQDQTDKNSYYQFFATSIDVTLPNETKYTKTLPNKTFPDGSSTTACYSYENEGVMFTTFSKQDDLFCTSGNG